MMETKITPSAITPSRGVTFGLGFEGRISATGRLHFPPCSHNCVDSDI